MFESFKTNLDLPKYCVGTYVEMAYVSVWTVNRDWEYEGKFDAIISEHDTCFSVCRISKKNVFEKRYYCFDLSKAKMQTEAKLERVKNNGEKTFLLKSKLNCSAVFVSFKSAFLTSTKLLSLCYFSDCIITQKLRPIFLKSVMSRFPDKYFVKKMLKILFFRKLFPRLQ